MANKPGSVRPLRDLAAIPLGRSLLNASARRTRGTGGGQPICAPYLVLLRAGFTMPALLPALRWALTPPFHPYPLAEAFGRFPFCGTFPRLTPGGR
ncbi:hypothetical protein HNE_0478 [Hyphomonas neptunium ATCC 15444]|uniref:Uncharacterized protein n=1 Tax=Hyphomonas neptunium (strain ATCC 15444) TaxID=228405 RepID=Q0C4Y5_HYPNA|nr:hypothetical protein HNE_0478 [Hyphomonas neptunium ATCC 15444]